jgi:hypothetical protein
MKREYSEPLFSDKFHDQFLQNQRGDGTKAAVSSNISEHILQTNGNIQER